MLISEIAQLLSGRMFGEDGEIFGLNSLFAATKNDATFIIWPKDVRFAKTSSAACIIAEESVVADHADAFSASMIAIKDIAKALQALQSFFVSTPAQEHHVGSGTVIGAHAVVMPGAAIGAHCVIGPGAIIYPHVTIKDGCRIGAHSVLGSDAFVPHGLSPSVMLPSLGRVAVEEGVSIGALCTIDRGLLSATTIKRSALLDNMVHVGHDVIIGENVVIAAQSAFAGLVVVGDHATLGGQVGVAPHVSIGAFARISGKSMVHCDIKPYEIWSGNPSVPHSIYLRAYGQLMNKGKNHDRGRKRNLL